MRLLLDEMYSSRIAAALRSRGHDVEAVGESEMRSSTDLQLLEAASATGQAVVTEDREDFAVLDWQMRRAGRTHAGIVMVAARRYPRARTTEQRLVDALHALLRDPPPMCAEPSFVWWLE